MVLLSPSSSPSTCRMSLSRCCNAPSFLFTTKRNTPAGTKLRYEVDTSGILPITAEIFKMFPDVSLSALLSGTLPLFPPKDEFLCPSPSLLHQEMPYSKSQFKKCAVVGNGGIIKNSKCGKEIDSADFVFRFFSSKVECRLSEPFGPFSDAVCCPQVQHTADQREVLGRRWHKNRSGVHQSQYHNREVIKQD